MAGRFPAAKLIAVALLALLAACVEVTPNREPATPEAELSRQARALQRTILEGAATGAVAGAGGAYVFGGRGNLPGGILIGIPVGVAAGTYVGYLQQNYATNEARLERLRADIEVTIAETDAALRTMRVIVGQQRRQLAAAGAGAPEPAARATAERSLNDMALAIDGAANRLDEFNATRALRLVPGQATGVDAQIADLSRRIAEMRGITDTLAGEI
jgi:uncharacterized membrane protein